MEIKIGSLYKHYKGHIYKVINIGVHTETGEEMVVYSPIDDPNLIWIRPSCMFHDIIDYDKRIKRFEEIDNGEI